MFSNAQCLSFSRSTGPFDWTYEQWVPFVQPSIQRGPLCIAKYKPPPPLVTDMQTKTILTIIGAIQIFMGTFLWIQAVIVRDAGIMSAAFDLKAPGQTITPEVYLVVASTVDTVGAFNIGIGAMLLSLRNLEVEPAKMVLRGAMILGLIALTISAAFNEIFMEGGPPLPVWILLTIFVSLSAYGYMKGTGNPTNESS